MPQDFEQTRHVGIAIIGAGMGGMAFAIALKNRWGFEDFVMLEKAQEVGGTWRDSQYPGCSSDVPMHWYSLSTDLKPDWVRPYALHNEIQGYLVDVASKHSLHSHCEFNSSVISADWIEDEKAWHIRVENLKTKASRLVIAKALVSAIGLFFKDLIPNIPGLDQFKGPVFHSSHWRHDVDLKGKNVAVIGNGCSATQLVPVISQDSSVKVVNFARTPMWLVPPLSNGDYPAIMRWIFKTFPGALRAYRAMIFWTFEMRFIVHRGRHTLLHDFAAKILARYIRSNAPEKYHNQMIPDYTVGCKRLIINSNYLSCLHQPNVELTYQPIENVTETSIVASGEEFPIDVIVCATGFETNTYPISVRGRTGRTIQQYWQSQNGPTAYKGTTLPGFPNFVMLAGPNAASGHASLTFIQESQVNYALGLLKPVMEGVLSSVEISDTATASYNTWIQHRLSNSVFTQCSSWYRSGSTGQGKISSMWPGPASLFWWQTLGVTWRDHLISEREKGSWRRYTRKQRVKRSIVFLSTAVVVSGIGALMAMDELHLQRYLG